jgi:hypothetical protein
MTVTQSQWIQKPHKYLSTKFQDCREGVRALGGRFWHAHTLTTCLHLVPRLKNVLSQGWANSGPLKVFLWPAKTVRKIRLEYIRCSLTDINLQAVMRISTSNLTPDFKSVIRYICLIKLILKLNVLAAIDDMKLAQ